MKSSTSWLSVAIHQKDWRAPNVGYDNRNWSLGHTLDTAGLKLGLNSNKISIKPELTLDYTSDKQN